MIGALTNNGYGEAGINWAVRLIPVRIRASQLEIENVNAAAGIDYAVASGAPISNNSWRVAGGGYEYSQEIYDAINRAWQAGHLFVTGAGNDGTDNDVNPPYPPSYDLDNIIAATVVDANNQAPYNYGLTSVDLGSPSPGAASGASSHTSGVAALLKSAHPDWTYAQIRDRILSTVEPVPSLEGKTVTGGRLNAARALATTSISITDPEIIENDSGTTQLVFTVERFGASTEEMKIEWVTTDGTATAGSDYVAAAGVVTFLPSGADTQTFVVDVIGDTFYETAETLYVELNIVSGAALLADPKSQGQILNDDAPSTKFYVVNDALANETYEYDPNGALVENYSLDTGNSAPRGAASTTAGDKTWVVDANKSVYAYDNSGTLLGSWTAGSLHSKAQTEGITTDGTDVWIVDSYRDRVYRYTGAAGRLSGSQYAASSFALNTGNRGPKGITTDGQYLWVVNDNSTDKVFKYTLSGSLVGSWAISSGGGRPTGITLDLANMSDVWIVDNSSAQVYQYTAAVSRTSGSQSPAASFALAAGNTNPQGIADPPAAAATQSTADISATHVATPPRRTVTRLDAMDLLFAQDDDSLSRRGRRVIGGLDALIAR